MVSVPQYLDFEKLFVTDIVGIGNDNLFILLSFLIIVSLAAKLKISNKNFMVLMIVWGLILGGLGYTSILAIILIIVAFILSMGYRRLLGGF